MRINAWTYQIWSSAITKACQPNPHTIYFCITYFCYYPLTPQSPHFPNKIFVMCVTCWSQCNTSDLMNLTRHPLLGLANTFNIRNTTISVTSVSQWSLDSSDLRFEQWAVLHPYTCKQSTWLAACDRVCVWDKPAINHEVSNRTGTLQK
jgi:hypothetical protein